jgi:hypothetical protein
MREESNCFGEDVDQGLLLRFSKDQEFGELREEI